MSHTPGPWTSHGNAVLTGDEKRQVAAIIPHGVAHTMGDGKTIGELTATDKADSRLIAAAPDLLAACEMVKAAFKNIKHGTSAQFDALAAVDAVLAKAVGK